MQIDLNIAISIIGAILAVATFVIGRASAHKSSGKETGTLLAELRQVGEDVRDIKAEVSTMRIEQSDMRDRLTRLETKVEMYHGEKVEK